MSVSTTIDVCTCTTRKGNILTEKSLFLSITVFIGARKCRKINSYICNYPFIYLYKKTNIHGKSVSVKTCKQGAFRGAIHLQQENNSKEHKLTLKYFGNFKYNIPFGRHDLLSVEMAFLRGCAL